MIDQEVCVSRGARPEEVYSLHFQGSFLINVREEVTEDCDCDFGGLFGLVRTMDFIHSSFKDCNPDMDEFDDSDSKLRGSSLLQTTKESFTTNVLTIIAWGGGVTRCHRVVLN